MPLTFKEFRSIVAPHAGRAGKCASASEVATFSRQVMEYLLYSGSESGVKRLCIQAHNRCLSLPPEVEIPIKVRIDNRSADLWNKWHTFHNDDHNWERCWPASDALREDGARTPLAYDLPPGGSILGIMATCDEANSSVIVQGQDLTGREIYTFHQGEKIVGEKFTLKKNEIRYGQVVFGNVTGIIKPETNGYVLLYAVDPAKNETTKFLADWNPSEKKPLYRRMRVEARECNGPVVSLSMLCRVRLKDSYVDNELTLFDNSLAVLMGAQRLQAEVNNDVQIAGYKRQAVEDILEKEGGFKKISGNPVDVFQPMSGGAIRNIVGSRGFSRFGRN